MNSPLPDFERIPVLGLRFEPEAFIAQAPWRFAKTMPEQPHEYTTRGETPDEEFEAFVRFIREHGYRARYGRNVYTYLKLGDWRYWTMGWPVAQTRIINRASEVAVGA